jgi:hypothetical protein
MLSDTFFEQNAITWLHVDDQALISIAQFTVNSKNIIDGSSWASDSYRHETTVHQYESSKQNR